jgi:hypothetical protein
MESQAAKLSSEMERTEKLSQNKCMGSKRYFLPQKEKI